MKNLYNSICLPVLFIFACSGGTKKAETDQYVINRSATSGKCVVEPSDAAGIGPSLDGKKYDSKEDARVAMCNAYDPGSADVDKCSDVGPKDACK